VEVVVNAIIAAIALAALVVSIVVAVKQAGVAREQTAIQERLAAVEEARRADEVEARSRARVTARIVRVDMPPIVSTVPPPPPSVWLVLHNEGAALARGVGLDVESLDGNPVPPVNGVEVLPVDLQPTQQMTFHVPVSMGDAAIVRVTVRWIDGAGDHEEPFALQTV
jgi:hypothetical protein